MANVALNAEMITGPITGAVDHVHAVSSSAWTVFHSETTRALKPTDGTTPAAAKYTAMANLWSPALKVIYSDPAAPKIINDPSIGKGRVALPPPPPPPPGKPSPNAGADSQIGISWNSIKFNGIGVSGQFQLILNQQNGGFNFTGTFFDPDALDYTDSLAIVVVDSQGVAYQFAHTGNMQGWADRWFEGGSKTDAWGNAGSNPVLAADWNNLWNSTGGAAWSWHAVASINVAIGPLLNMLMTLVNAIQAISKVVSMVAA